MKKLLTLALSVMLSGMALTQSLEVMHSSYNTLRLHYQGAPLEVGSTTLFGEQFSTLEMGTAFTTLNPGEPALPMVSAMVEVPLCEGFTIELTLVRGDTLSGLLPHPLVPAQPSRSKSDRSTPTLVMDRALYQQDAFLGGHPCEVERVGVARSKNLATVQFCPVQYNPVTGQLAEVKEAWITIHYKNPDISATQALAKHSSLAFAPQTLNQLPCSKDIASAQTAPIHYLIVANPMFRGQLDEFVAWKQRKGYLVTVAYTDQPEVGTTASAIASYTKSFYTNATPELPAPTYLLLVGDCAQLPPHNGRWDYSGQSANQQKTDLYYATWTEGDNIPDCYYGRFSAENISQLTPQVEKTLMYEQYTFADPTFLDKAILVAGVDNGYQGDNGYKFGDPAMDYAAKLYVTPQRFPGGVTYYKNATNIVPEGVTVTGSSQSAATATTLRQLYSEGAGWINYTAHGDVTEWYQPNFSNSHVSQMTNREKFGIMIGNCCLTGKFDETCLGEALLRKDNLCGAVNYFGGSNVTYWYEDFYWSVGARASSSINGSMNAQYDAQNMGMYDRLFHTHGEARDEWYTSAGGIMMGGNLAVQSSASSASAKNYYWEVYHCFGDPSVSPWLGQAPAMSVNAQATLPVGSATYDIQAAPYAYCALTDGQGTLIGAAFANANGQASIPTGSISAPGTYELACSAQGFRTHFSQVLVHVLNGPFVKVNNIRGELVAGRESAITVELENVGTQATEQLSIELIVDGRHLFLLQGGQQTVDNLPANQTCTLSGLFTAQVLPTVANMTTTEVQAIVRWGRQSTQMCQFSSNLRVNAPDLTLTTEMEGTPEPGTTLTLTAHIANQGSADAYNLRASLICLEPAIAIDQTETTIGHLSCARDNNTTLTYALTLDSTLPDGCNIPLFLILSNDTLTLQRTLSLSAGQGEMEDFESADFTAFPWQQGTYAWEITTSDPYAGTCSARSRTWSSSAWGGSNSGNNSTSDMQIEWTSTADDSISFYYKVSSEANYDFFRFYIDNVEQMQASGNVGWTHVAFPVSAGTHTFRFAYTKDASQRSGSDCVWVDNITFPLTGIARHYALDTACLGESYPMTTYTYTADAEGTVLLSDTAASSLYFTLLTVLPLPELTLEADVTTVRKGECALLTASGAQTYLWSTGELTPQLRVYPQETTTYEVTGRNGRCSATQSITITVDGTIGVGSVAEPTLSVYPNPTTGELRIENLELRGQTLELYDMTGRLILRQETLNSQFSTLNLTDLPSGIYLLRAGGQVHKVVKR